MTIQTNQQSQKFLVIDGEVLIIENPEIIGLFTTTDQWPGEVHRTGRKLIEPCKEVNKCLDGEEGKEICGRECKRTNRSEEIYVMLLPYKNLERLSKGN
jgi:hypothetical protein